MRGPMAAEMMMGAQSKLEEAIEELREKYERKAELEAKAAMDADCRACQDNAKAAAEDAERERVNPTVDLTMEDPGLEALRQARLAELREKVRGYELCIIFLINLRQILINRPISHLSTRCRRRKRDMHLVVVNTGRSLRKNFSRK